MRISDWSSDVCSSDLFVDKSRSFSILLHRLRTVLAGRRTPGDVNALPSPGLVDVADAGKARIGALTLDPDVGRAYWKDRLVPLTLTEFHIVHALAAAAGRDMRYLDIHDLVHVDGFQPGAAAEGYRPNSRGFTQPVAPNSGGLDPD